MDAQHVDTWPARHCKTAGSTPAAGGAAACSTPPLPPAVGAAFSGALGGAASSAVGGDFGGAFCAGAAVTGGGGGAFCAGAAVGGGGGGRGAAQATTVGSGGAGASTADGGFCAGGPLAVPPGWRCSGAFLKVAAGVAAGVAACLAACAPPLGGGRWGIGLGACCAEEAPCPATAGDAADELPAAAGDRSAVPSWSFPCSMLPYILRNHCSVWSPPPRVKPRTHLSWTAAAAHAPAGPKRE